MGALSLIAAAKPFNRLYRLSVLINSLQMIMVAVVFLRMVG
jgi:hypothetical protein